MSIETHPAHIPLRRRFSMAFLALCISGFLFRGALATALVTRGDDFFQKGRVERARMYYARALFFDSRATLAADRYAFSALEMRTPEALRSSIRVATAALAYAPSDAALLEDRGLLYLIERRYRQAREDLLRAAAITGDPRWRRLAAQAAQR
jgi:tetratricopeptide (TPR) repeat protein